MPVQNPKTFTKSQVFLFHLKIYFATFNTKVHAFSEMQKAQKGSNLKLFIGNRKLLSATEHLGNFKQMTQITLLKQICLAASNVCFAIPDEQTYFGIMFN